MNRLYKGLSNIAIIFYILILVVCTVVFISKPLPILWVVFGFVQVVGFFYFSSKYFKSWRFLRMDIFRKKLFRTSLILRLAWVVFSFFFYKYMTGEPFEFEAGDSMYYDWLASLGSKEILNGTLNIYKVYERVGLGVSDRGYPIYLSVVYFLTNNSIFIARIIKAIIGAYTCVLIYKIARRNFGEEIGRTAAILSMLLPNLIYYTGLHVKETEMIFLFVAFANQADLLIHSTRLSYKRIFYAIALGASLFYFRTVLGATAFFSLLVALIISSGKLVGYTKKIVIGFCLGIFVLFMVGSAINADITKYWDQKGTNQAENMVGRSLREKGNKLAVYGTSALFAPVIIMAPFPTLVNIETQQNQMLLSGGYFTRNVYAFFVILALLYLIKKKRYKIHALLIILPFTYLGIITLSAFALSERFHLPAIPFLLILAAVGINNYRKKNKNYFIIYMVGITIIIIGWNWFKMAGRDLI